VNNGQEMGPYIYDAGVDLALKGAPHHSVPDYKISLDLDLRNTTIYDTVATGGTATCVMVAGGPSSTGTITAPFIQFAGFTETIPVGKRARVKVECQAFGTGGAGSAGVPITAAVA
jgi:hypothetical protein